MFGSGISVAGDILDLAVKLEFVQKSGTWYTYNGEKIGQGRENSKKFLQENKNLLQELEQKIREKSDQGEVVVEEEKVEETIGA
jgi:recombination protein RecA